METATSTTEPANPKPQHAQGDLRGLARRLVRIAGVISARVLVKDLAHECIGPVLTAEADESMMAWSCRALHFQRDFINGHAETRVAIGSRVILAQAWDGVVIAVLLEAGCKEMKSLKRTLKLVRRGVEARADGVDA